MLILTNSYSFGTISNGVSTGTAAFSLSVNNNITDLHDVDFTIDITDNGKRVNGHLQCLCMLRFLTTIL